MGDARASIAERWRRVDALAGALMSELDAGLVRDDDPAEVTDLAVRLRELARVQRAEAAAAASAPAAELQTRVETGTPAVSPPLSRRLEQLAAEVELLVRAHGALYTAARLLYEPDVCDLAHSHALGLREVLAEFDDLLPVAVGRELQEAGLTCGCVCPACGIGACLCLRNSIDTVRDHQHRDPMSPSNGIDLRIPPRPGSQLAAAGLDVGDVVLSVDGEVVTSNKDLQLALRNPPMGEPVTLVARRGGETREVTVARVSDLPA